MEGVNYLLMSTLERLQTWYHTQCNGEWEHASGVTIETLDNPGWLLTINLEGTSLEDASFPGVYYGVGADSESAGHDWLDCKVDNKVFTAAGGPHKLEEMLTTFLEWADRNA